MFVYIFYVLPVGGKAGMLAPGSTAARGTHMLAAGSQCRRAARNIHKIEFALR